MTLNDRNRAPWTQAHSYANQSVWPTGQHSTARQLRTRGYAPESHQDTWATPPAIAEHAIKHYSTPGALVIDPDCGFGVVLVEALRANRHAAGITTSPQWWRTARANVTAAKRSGAWHDGTVIHRRDHPTTTVHTAGLHHRADLVLTTIRTTDLGTSLSPDSDYTRTIASLLRPGGHAVLVVRSHRAPDGTLIDLASVAAAAAEARGLILVDRCIALTARIRGTRVLHHESAVDHAARPLSTPVAAAAHHTVLVLRAPDTSASALTADPREIGQAQYISTRNERAHG
nr:DNA methyltransferase [Kibdelosporangium sp. MJ126-NF4]CEL13544.1 hypothetical protein [Kibdelosporangium sp. MJ126-NF4]CTQ99229.1 hypothetical protein [Kibdelosporangium sp. MJ126-NF4]